MLQRQLQLQLAVLSEENGEQPTLTKTNKSLHLLGE